jgi:nicotinamide mononucleotide transporter
MIDKIEYGANIFYVLSTFFASRNSLHTWWTGIISCLLFMISFFHVKLYADVTLQTFFIATCIYGWISWKNGGQNKKPLPITHISWKQFLFFVCLALCIMGIYGTFLYKLTNANNPFWDSTILTFSILGQFLIMKRKFENWYIWFLVDSIAIPLYYSKGLHLTALLYLFLLCLGVYGYWNWKKELRLMAMPT